MQLLYGKSLAQNILQTLHKEVEQLPFQPSFADVVVGDDLVSKKFASLKARRARAIGLRVIDVHVPATITVDELILQIKKVQEDPHLAGLIVQLPLPFSLDTERVVNAIAPDVDVDVLTLHNTNAFYENNPLFKYPTVQAIMQLIDTQFPHLSDVTVAVLGQGKLVGKPLAHILERKGAHVLRFSREHPLSAEEIKTADIVVSGLGHPRFVQPYMVHPLALVIDAGTSEVLGSVLGDVDIPAFQSAGFEGIIAPVPGGVGPLTIGYLLYNIVISAKRKNHVA